jgi:hypothetical protein
MSEHAELHEKARKLYDAADGDPQRLATVAAQFQQAAGARPSGALEVVGGVSVTTGKAYVQFAWGENRGQVDVDTARGHAQNVLEACSNATADAALLAWARDELDLDLDRGAHLIDAVRRYRADRWGQPDLEVELGKPAAEEDGG